MGRTVPAVSKCDRPPSCRVFSGNVLANIEVEGGSIAGNLHILDLKLDVFINSYSMTSAEAHEHIII
jgi:hypothetical protein